MLARYAARSVRTSLLADLSLFRAVRTSSFMGLASVEDVPCRFEEAYIELVRDPSTPGRSFSEVGDTPSRSDGGMVSGKSIL